MSENIHYWRFIYLHGYGRSRRLPKEFNFLLKLWNTSCWEDVSLARNRDFVRSYFILYHCIKVLIISSTSIPILQVGLYLLAKQQRTCIISSTFATIQNHQSESDQLTLFDLVISLNHMSPMSLLRTCHVGTKCWLSTLVWILATWIVVYHVLCPSRAEIQHSQQIGISQPALKNVGRETPNLSDLKNVGRETPNLSDLKNNSTRTRAEEEAKLQRLKKLASLLFPRKELAMDASKPRHREVGYYYPGREWRDTAGNPIQAHGGGIIYVPDTQTFYWYGENKAGRTYHLSKRSTARVDVVGINCYSSKDLWTWKSEGLALKGEKRDRTSDLYIKNVLERPKVIYNDRTKLYVMWMHIDNGNYSKAAVGVAVSTQPGGPFEYLGSKRPHGCDSRDMTVFKDDNGDAYIVYSSQANNELHVGTLTEDYLDVVERGMQKILIKQRREAPVVFKHRSIYYMLSSGCSSWNPNGALIHASDSMLGPWLTIGDPCLGGNEELRSLTFFSQGSFVLPLPGLEHTFIYMGDRWLPANLRDSRYVWLPLSLDGPLGQEASIEFNFEQVQRVSIHWADKWKLPQGWNSSRHGV